METYFLGTNILSSLPPVTKLVQGNVFTPVCHSVHSGGGPRGLSDTPLPSTSWDNIPPVQCMLGYTPPAQCVLGYGQQVGSMHPTGMHTCCQFKMF